MLTFLALSCLHHNVAKVVEIDGVCVVGVGTVVAVVVMVVVAAVVVEVVEVEVEVDAGTEEEPG